MTVEEFSLEFDILYDNASSSGAPGLDIYDKSVFATHANEEFVKLSYSGYNNVNKGFENSENRRNDLNLLIVPYSTNVELSAPFGAGLSNNSKFYAVPEDTWYIVWERINTLSLTTEVGCDTNPETIKVHPVTHDEYNRSSENPFRKPNKRKAWRVDLAKINNFKTVEIISIIPINRYDMRYLKQPRPIILGNFEDDPETTGRNLTINGLNTTQQLELSPETHRDVLKMAVAIAIQRYRENTLSNSVQLDQKII